MNWQKGIENKSEEEMKQSNKQRIQKPEKNVKKKKKVERRKQRINYKAILLQDWLWFWKETIVIFK